MNILYVTTLWTGLYEMIFNGSTEIKGMPAFIKPLKELIDRGYNVDFVIIHNETIYPEYNIKIDWLNEKMFIGNVYWNKSLLKKVNNIIRLYDTVSKIVKNKRYDFIYAHGESATISRIVANKNKIPFGQRLYGTFLYDYIKKNGLLKAKIIHFLEYDSFKSKKNFLLITNDGSKGDEAYKIINKDCTPSKLYFWYNGVDKFPEVSNEVLKKEYINLGSKPFLFYVSRIDNWKRQDEAIKILKLINDKGHDFNLYIAGQIFNHEYYDYLNKLINELNLSKNVFFMGSINRKTIHIMSRLAICSFSLYDICNLGNVFFEIFSDGGIIMSKNDGSLNFFVEHEKNGFLLDNILEAPQYIECILSDREYEYYLRNNAKNTSMKKTISWKERIENEIKLIEDAIKMV